MAGKNHKRYKMRKHMNSIKHEPVSLFKEPPVLISTWEELSKLENDNYRLDINPRACSGYIVPKDKSASDEYLLNDYLSTHTFYAGTYFQTTVKLRNLGFNIQLANWDGETIYCKQ